MTRFRRPLTSRPRESQRTLAVAGAVFLFAFGLYGLTTAFPSGYEPETAAVTEGFVNTGRFQMLRDSPFQSRGHVGKDGRLYGRVGLPQPLLESPFYLVGRTLDRTATSADNPYRFRVLAFSFYNPFFAALTASLVFLIVLLANGSRRWALAIAALFTAASIAWPYAKIGMETTLMFAVASTLLGALLARRTGRAWAFALTGFAAGMAFASKPYAGPVLLPVGALLLPPLRAASPSERVRLVVALLLPGLAWVGAFGWYNWTRHGSPFDSNPAPYSGTLAAPFNFVGFLVSPGKGLLFYSPLVLLGLLGLRQLWKVDRQFTIAIGGCFLLGVLAVSASAHWTDETWGPRYIVNVAWLLLLPIPWWATSLRRRRVLSILAIVAVAVQLVGVLAPYSIYPKVVGELTGLDPYAARDRLPRPRETGIASGKTDVPLGRDPSRWIPQVSPLVIQSAIVASAYLEKVGLPAITYRYIPFEGLPTSVDLDDVRARLDIKVPDVWWETLYPGTFGDVGAVILTMLLLCGALGMLRSGGIPLTPRRGPSSEQPGL